MRGVFHLDDMLAVQTESNAGSLAAEKPLLPNASREGRQIIASVSHYREVKLGEISISGPIRPKPSVQDRRRKSCCELWRYKVVVVSL